MNAQENIDELIGKYFSGEASPEEAMQLEDWKNISRENRLYYDACERLFYSQEHRADIANAWQKIRAQITVPGKIVPIRPFARSLRIAASVALVLGVGAVMYLLNNRSGTTIEYITHTESRHLVLEDGSDITLSPNSSLRADGSFGKKERTLRLKGSAYFSVVHKEEIPFVVDAGNVFIKDIGTKFLIRTSADTDTVYVHVDEGVVLLFDSLGSEVEIKAGGNALYVKSKRQLVSNLSETPQPVLVSFANNTLAEVVEKLNAAYNTRIEIANPALNKCTITTQFNNEKLETILSVIAETLGVTYEKTKQGFIFKGEVCNQ